ncbi:hypothetical protein [Alicyclobacillus herbarius]|uniref:hypothetical protein n=1 Tax=Alicyclobacillus herbarius TaxID=122960 RepID=UPI0012DBCF59|nr:hypothetical protein [Alicyclobacillus herbarius]
MNAGEYMLSAIIGKAVGKFIVKKIFNRIYYELNKREADDAILKLYEATRGIPECERTLENDKRVVQNLFRHGKINKDQLEGLMFMLEHAYSRKDELIEKARAFREQYQEEFSTKTLMN